MVFFPVGLLVDKSFTISLLYRIHIDPATVQKKFGIFGEPMTGNDWDCSGVFAGYDFKKVLLLGISIGGVMFILPRMVRILMEGSLPLSKRSKSISMPNTLTVMIVISDGISPLP